MDIFFKEAIINLKQTGSICCSSKYLVKKMLKPINFECEKKVKILELGAGNGVITKSILNSLSRNSELVVFELNANFCKELNKIEDKRLTIINDCASNILNYTTENSIDFVISSLPLAQIDKNLKFRMLIQTKKALKKRGLYIQYQYSLFDYIFLKKSFTNIEINFTVLNFPPAFIYNCR